MPEWSIASGVEFYLILSFLSRRLTGIHHQLGADLLLTYCYGSMALFWLNILKSITMVLYFNVHILPNFVSESPFELVAVFF